MAAIWSFIPPAFRITDARPIARSPRRLWEKPPPIASRSMSFQALRIRNRPYHQRQLLRELLDGALHESRGFGISMGD